MRDFGFQTSFASNAGVSRNATRCASPRSRNAFTLTEILIVLGIIVLMLGIAVPAFNIIRGNRSVDSAVNQVSALLGRARSEAIGLQEKRGVFFFVDPRNGRVTLAEVHEVDKPAGATRDTYLDLVLDPSDQTGQSALDFLVLTPGVGVQVVDDYDPKSASYDDRYIGYNRILGTY